MKSVGDLSCRRKLQRGFGLNDDNLHAPNEKLDLDNFFKGMEASALLMEELGAMSAELKKARGARRGGKASSS